MIEIILVAFTLMIAAITDIKNRKIYNKLIMPAAFISLVLVVIRGWDVFLVRVVAALLLFLFLYFATYRSGILPGGDIKALIFIMLSIGPGSFVVMLKYIAICSIPVIIYYAVKKEKTIPYAVPMFLASLVFLWRGFL